MRTRVVPTHLSRQNSAQYGSENPSMSAAWMPFACRIWRWMHGPEQPAWRRDVVVTRGRPERARRFNAAAKRPSQRVGAVASGRRSHGGR